MLESWDNDSDLSFKMWTYVQRISHGTDGIGQPCLKFQFEIVNRALVPVHLLACRSRRTSTGRARWRVRGVNRDLFLAVVAVHLCHQPQPTSVPQTTLHLDKLSSRFLVIMFVLHRPRGRCSLHFATMPRPWSGVSCGLLD